MVFGPHHILSPFCLVSPILPCYMQQEVIGCDSHWHGRSAQFSTHKVRFLSQSKVYAVISTIILSPYRILPTPTDEITHSILTPCQ